MERFVSQRRPHFFSPLPTLKRSTSTASAQLFNKYDKRWRWWHILTLVILAIALVEVVLLLVGYIFIQFQPPSIRIALRQYPKVTYKPLDQATFPSPEWRNSTSIYHITKEFGPATMGGMGMVLTALATEQQRTGQVDVNVVLPYYSYLKHKRKGEEFHRVADLVMYIQDKQQQPQQQSGATTSESSSLSSSSYLSSSAYKSSASTRTSSKSNSRSRSVHGTLTGDEDHTQQFQPQQQQWVPLEFRVTKWQYVTSPPPQAVNRTTWYIDDHGSNQTLPAGMQRPSLKHEKLTVYLIGPGNRTPFSMAFRARNPVEIYSSPKGLPQEWKDQYFLKAAATFLSFQASAASHDQSLFAPPSDLVSPSGVDVVHIHGATNAYLAHYLQDPTLWNAALPKPSVVYTMHDYLDELQYTNTVANVHRFDHSPPLSRPASSDLVPGSTGFTARNNADLTDAAKVEGSDSPLVIPTIHGNRMFMSSLAIDLANVVTFVSQTMAIEMVEGRMDFYLKELVMDSVLRKAVQGRFFGVSNGVDYRHAHPFQSKRLAKAKLAYPTYAWQQLTTLDIRAQQEPQRFILSGNVTTDYVSAQKDRAKRWLIRKMFLSENDKHRQIVLYVGRFQYNKGLASFDRAIQAFIKHNMILVIIGQPNNYPLDQVKQWQQQYPNHVHVLTTAQEQKSWLMYVRAATDLVFVPSLTESFGLVAAEGLMFGCPVLSTGVGGLKEFLVDRQRGTTVSAQSLETHPYNAYLYRLDQQQETTGDSMDSLEKAIEDAARDYLYLGKHRADRELFTLHMIDNALALGWRRRPKPAANNGNQQPLQPYHALSGPVYDYLRIYNLAIQDQYNKSNVGIKNSLLP